MIQKSAAEVFLILLRACCYRILNAPNCGSRRPAIERSRDALTTPTLICIFPERAERRKYTARRAPDRRRSSCGRGCRGHLLKKETKGAFKALILKTSRLISPFLKTEKTSDKACTAAARKKRMKKRKDVKTRSSPVYGFFPFSKKLMPNLGLSMLNSALNTAL